MYVIQCVNKEYLDPYLVSRQSQIDAGVPFEHLLFSYDDLMVPHIKLPEPTMKNTTPFTDVEFKGMVLRLAAFDWLKQNGFQRVLYLDCDTLVQSDLSELANINMNDNWIGASVENHCKYYRPAVYEHKYPEEEARRRSLNPEYFNSGVLLIDLHKFNGEFMPGFAATASEYIFPDQDYLNKLAVPFAKMPRLYNCLPEMRVPDLLETEHLIDVRREMMRAKIVHYAGRIKPYTSNGLDFYGLQLPYDVYYETAKRTLGVSEEFLSIIKGNVDRFETTVACVRPFL
ncbi:hypothetical protein KW516_19020 [Vibrio fluvialis]|nr:hypothetical protein [Vibrio fluvialis]